MSFGKDCYSDINSLLNKKIEEKKHLIAVHRGSWTGNIIQNTIPAYTCAFKMGADLVECDVNRTTDGVLFSFHDGYEHFIFKVDKSIKEMTSEEVESFHPYNCIRHQNSKPINRLSDILNWLPEGKFLNIDRAWDIFPYIFEELDRHPNALKQVVVKCPVNGMFHDVPVEDALKALENHPTKYMYMAICYNMDDVKKALSLKNVNLVGIETIIRSDDNELFKDEGIDYIHSHNLFVWINSIQLGDYDSKPLYGSLDDDISINDPDKGWGEMFRKKIDIIQTDWPALLYSYRREKIKND